MDLVTFAKKYRPLLVEMLKELHSETQDTILERRVRQAQNRCVFILNLRERSASKGHPIKDVEFRYSTYEARVESEMEEGTE